MDDPREAGFGVFILGMAVCYGYLGYELFSARWVDAAEVQSSAAAKLKEGWYADLAQGLAVAEREQKPVLIDSGRPGARTAW